MTRLVPLVLTLAALWPATSAAAVLTVGSGVGCTYSSVATAVSLSSANDTIRIAPGTWPANVSVSHSLTFESGTPSCGAFDPSAVVNLDGGGARVMTISSGAAVLLKNVNAGNGGGVDGGVVSVQSATLSLLDAGLGDTTVTGNGGCVSLDDAMFTMSGTSVVTRCAAGGDGGGVHAVDSWLVLYGDAGVVDNDAGGDGGGLFVEGANSFLVYDSFRVEDNEAGGDGGGILARNSTQTVGVSGFALVHGNHASGNGGGIAVDGMKLTVTDTATISLNTADVHGGGLAAQNADVTLSGDAAVVVNTAEFRGGGVWILGNAAGVTVTVSESAAVSFNGARDGGGIDVDAFAGLAMGVLLEGARIEGNFANNFGGGIASTGQLEATGAEIVGNEAVSDGGGLWLVGDADLTNVRIEDNASLDGDGGGAWVFGEVVVDDDSATCDASLLAADEYCSQFVGNSAANGGAVFVAGTFESHRTAYRMNSASDKGSAVRVQASGSALVANARVTENAASITGGALDNDGVLVVHHATVAKNDSRGVVYATGSTGSVDRSVLFSALTGAELFLDSGVSLTVACSDIDTIGGTGSHTGSGNISSNPNFVTTARGGFHIDSTSPAHDRCPRYSTLDEQDQDQEQRVSGALVGMGAFEGF
jgi:predicted outer membrane repeat protein